MPLTRQQKEERVAKAQADLSAATSVVFLTFDGLTVEDSEKLREQMSEAGVKLRIMPKRLLNIVAQNLKLSLDVVALPGQVAVVWGGDAVAPAKIIYEFARRHDNVKMVSGVLEGQLISAEEVLALAKLPSREQLIGQVVGTIAGPLRGLVMVLSGVQRETVQVLKAIADKKQTEAA